MKILLFILLPAFIFAQYGKNLLTVNPDFELTTGWSDYLGGDTNERSSTQAHDGTYSRHLSVDANNEGCIQATSGPTVTSGNVYLFGIWIYRVSGTEITLIDNNSRFPGGITSTGGVTGSWQKVQDERTASATNTIRPRIVSTGGAAEWYGDDIFVRNKLDTIYIDPVGGDDTNEGNYANNIKTYEESALRGFYSGGVVAQLVNGSYMDITGLGKLYSDNGQDKGYKETGKYKMFKDRK